MASSHVELRELGRRGSIKIEATTASVDNRDEHDCLDLLTRMAKRHGKSPKDCELLVKTGIRTEKFRL